MSFTRRHIALGGAAALAAPFTAPLIAPAWAQSSSLKVGLMLPYSGTYAQLGEAITRGIDLYVKQNNGALAGRKIEFVKVDDESEPTKATELTNKLVLSDKVDVLIGTVHSGVALAMAKIAREAGLPTIVPNAGADLITRGLCADNIFRSSFANGQPAFATGKAMIDAGIKEASIITWRYSAGEESAAGFKEAFLAGGGKILKEIYVPFPDVEFQSALAEIAAQKPQAVYAFFAGGGAAKFIKDYAGAKLNETVPLWGVGFLTDGVEKAVGPAGDGIKTVLHYVDSLDNPANKAFRAAYNDAFKVMPDVYSVQGYDAAHLLGIGLTAVNGDVSKRKEMFAAMSAASFDSPRGPFKLSSSHNPVQNFYVRELKGGENRYLGVAATALADSGKGCKLV